MLKMCAVYRCKLCGEIIVKEKKEEVEPVVHTCSVNRREKTIGILELVGYKHLNLTN